MVVDVGEARQAERVVRADARRAARPCTAAPARTCPRSGSRRRSPGSRRPRPPRRRPAPPRPAGRRRRRTATRTRAGRWRAAAATRSGLNCAQRLDAPSELLTNTVEIPAAWARPAIVAMLPPSAFGSSQIHMPLPLKTSGQRPRRGRRPADPRRRGDRDLDRVRAPAGVVGDGHADRSGRGPGGDARDVARARVVQLGRQRTAAPAERDPHALVDALAGELQLLADRHLDRALAGRAGGGDAPDPGQFRWAFARLRGRGERQDERDHEKSACLHHRHPTPIGDGKFRCPGYPCALMRRGRNRQDRPPHVGAALLAKALVGVLIVFLCAGGATAAAGYLQFRAFVDPEPIPGEPTPDPDDRDRGGADPAARAGRAAHAAAARLRPPRQDREGRAARPGAAFGHDRADPAGPQARARRRCCRCRATSR